MAQVTINTENYDAATLLVSSENTNAQQLYLVATQTQDYKVTINGGVPFNVRPGTPSALIPFTCSTANQLMTIVIQAIDGGAIANITQVQLTSSGGYFNMNVSSLNQFPNILTFQGTSSSQKVNTYGNVSDIPNTITTFKGGGALVGSTSDFPTSLNTLYIYKSDHTLNISGSFGGFPSTLAYLSCYAVAGMGVTGNSATFPTSLVSMYGNYHGAFTVDMGALPASLETLSFSNSGTPNLTLTGSINALPAGFIRLRVENGLTCDLTGSLDNLPATVTSFEIFNGSITDTNTISGDIANVPPNLANLSLHGNNTVTGNLNTVPANAFNSITIHGANTITGTIESFTGARYSMSIKGNNTISGDLGLISEQIYKITIGGNNTIAGFTDPPSFTVYNASSFRFEIEGLNTLDSAEVDAALIFLNNNLSIVTALPITITGNSQTRTAASDTAYNGLISKGYNVTLN